MEIECDYCKYAWDYKGNLYYAQCPRCRKLSKIKKEDDA